MHLAVTLLPLVLLITRPASVPVPVEWPGSGPVLNEFVAGPARDWDGSGTFSTRDDEWIEVYNPGSEAVDLAQYLLTDGARLPRYAFTGVLGAGERLLVFGKDAYDWEKANGHPAYGLSLSNSGDAVMLMI